METAIHTDTPLAAVAGVVLAARHVPLLHRQRRVIVLASRAVS